MKVIIFIVTLFFVIGPVPKTPLGLLFDTIIVVSLLLWAYSAFFMKIKVHRSINKLSVFFIYILFYFALVSLPVSYFVNNNMSMGIVPIMKPVRILITVFGSIGLFYLYVKYYKDGFDKAIYRNLLIILLINSIIMICQAFIPAVNTFLNKVLFINISEIHFQVKNRPGGLFLSGGAIPSLIIGLGLMLLPIMLIKKQISYFFAICTYLIIIFTIPITGRTGLITAIISPVVLIIISKNKNYIQNIVVVVIVMTLIVVGYTKLEDYSKKSKNNIMVFNLNRLNRLLYPYIEKEEYAKKDATISTIFSKISIPDKTINFLLGDITFSNYVFSAVSDMGYNLNLYRYGIIGMMFFYLPMVFVMRTTLKYKLSKQEKIYYVSFFLIFFIGDIKESFMYSRNSFSIMLLLFYTMLYSKELSSPKK